MTNDNSDLVTRLQTVRTKLDQIDGVSLGDVCRFLDSMAVDMDAAIADANAVNSHAALLADNARLREALQIIVTNAHLIPDPEMDGMTDVYGITLDDFAFAEEAISPKTDA